MPMIILCVFILISAGIFEVNGFDVTLTHNGPVIIGGTINFEAEVHGAFYESFRFIWEDNAGGRSHSDTMYGKSKSQWNVTYVKGETEPGKYRVEVDVCEFNLITYWPCSKISAEYEVTAGLNGKLEVLQNSTVVKNAYVSNHTEVEHRITIKESDLKVLHEHNFTLISFWLINCTYLGVTPDVTFRYNYTTADEDFIVKAIVVAAKINETSNTTEIIPPTVLVNGTSQPLNISIINPLHPNKTAVIEKSLNISSTALNSTYNLLKNNLTATSMEKSTNGTIEKSGVANSTAKGKEKTLNTTSSHQKQILMKTLESHIKMEFKKDNIFVPWPDGSCNTSFIPTDPDKLYGYFHHAVKPRRPVEVQHVTGNNWLENGDLLNLTVRFTGSQPYHHCIQFISGEHNSTGNETCQHTTKITTNEINLVHYFGRGDKHTVLFIIKNSVSKTVSAVIVTNYIAKKHPQLSVVIVPVSFIALAIVLIIFGVAYYIQSINRGPIEVADFDFSANNDTEYKSFKGRLMEALSTAFTRSSALEEEPEEGPTWSPSRNVPNKPRMFTNSSDSE